MGRSREEIFAEVRNVTAAMFGLAPESLAPSSRMLEDLDLDSIDAVNLAVKLDTIFGKRIEARDFREMHTLQDVVEAVYALLEERG